MNRSRLTVVMLLVLCTAAFAGGATDEMAGGELTYLTWNHGFYEDTIDLWMAEFSETHPNVELNWVDKPGGELPTYFQTQLAAGDPPDLVDIQGTIWYGYADDGILYDLTDMMNGDAEMRNRFEPSILDVGGRFNDKLYAIPHYAASTVIFYNIPMFEAAGITSRPETLDELIEYANRLSTNEVAGFITLNFDWMYWPLFKAAGVDILNQSKTAAAFNTPAAVQVLQTLQDLTASGVIDEVAWTGRWSEPNGMFGAGNAAMLQGHLNANRAFRSNSDWASDPDNVGVMPFPGEWSVPNYHSFVMTANTDVPQAAWDFLKIVTNAEWNIKYAVDIGTLPSNTQALGQLLSDPNFGNENPFLERMFAVGLEVSDHLTGTTGVAQDAEIKDAVWSQIQQAALGQKSPQAALAAAETAVNRILGR